LPLPLPLPAPELLALPLPVFVPEVPVLLPEVPLFVLVPASAPVGLPPPESQATSSKDVQVNDANEAKRMP
jgi:hypothetical protein